MVRNRNIPVRSRFSKQTMGQDDHVDAWLMSYADMITLLLMLFILFVSLSGSKHGNLKDLSRSEPQRPYVFERYGTINLGTPFDETYQLLVGLVSTNRNDQNISVEKTQHGMWVDMSSVAFFKQGSADIPEEALPLLQSVARTITSGTQAGDIIEVEGYTSDEELGGDSPFANNWELASMRAARIASILTEQGVSASRLRAVGYGANNPVVPNTDEAGNPILENQKRNQRVVIWLQRPVAPASEPDIL